LAPEELNDTTCNLEGRHENLLVGFEGNEDASIYKITDDIALVQTVDFITPVVDDPFVYGQIAAANSLSDVFAMGGNVKTALNLVGFDSCHHGREVLKEILRGGEDKIKECGGVLAGGHTIETPEMLYGLSVTGVVHPEKMIRNNTLEKGDVIILTKPLGMGILTTAIKADLVSDDVASEVAEILRTLNYKASIIAREIGVNAMTDVTGFGLLGHLYEMSGKNFTIEIEFEKVPFIQEAINQASMGIIPAGSYNNQIFVEKYVEFVKNLTFEEQMILFDAQTSGGLLISISQEKADEFIKRAENEGVFAKIIGNVKEKENKFIKVV
jgi:selenide,water dikinase